MQNIKFIFDTEENKWTADTGNFGYTYNELQFSFISSYPRTKFVNLKFSYSIQHEDKIISEKHYPLPGVQYEYADSGPLAVAVELFEPEKKYYITVSATNNGVFKQHTFEVVGIKPIQPFPSWIWDGSTWISPIPRPTNGLHEWNELTHKWERVGDYVTNVVDPSAN